MKNGEKVIHNVQFKTYNRIITFNSINWSTKNELYEKIATNKEVFLAVKIIRKRI